MLWGWSQLFKPRHPRPLLPANASSLLLLLVMILEPPSGNHVVVVFPKNPTRGQQKNDTTPPNTAFLKGKVKAHMYPSYV